MGGTLFCIVSLLSTMITDVGISGSIFLQVCPSALLTWRVTLRVLLLRLVLLIPLSRRLFFLLKAHRLIWLGTLIILFSLVSSTLFLSFGSSWPRSDGLSPLSPMLVCIPP